MKTAFVADTHLRGKDLDSAREQLKAMVLDIIRRGDVERAVFLGDVFDRPMIGDGHASTGAIVMVAIEAVRNLTKHNIEVYLLVGNHDQSGPGSADALHVFDGMANVFIARYSQRAQVGACQIVFVPWSWEGGDPEDVISDRVNSAREASAPGTKIILAAHVQVVGAKMNGNFTCEASPGKWQVRRSFLESLDVDHIALGDFHARQGLIPKGGYVGALRQLGFGEEGNPAGFEIWDSETGKTEWVELDAAPRYQTATVSSQIDAAALPATLPAYGVNLRVIYDGVDPDPAQAAKLAASGVRIEKLIEREERLQRAEIPDGILDNPSALIDLYAAGQNPPMEPARIANIRRAYDLVTADRNGDAK